MAAPFQPDIFSDSRPVFVPTREPLAAAVRAAAARYHPTDLALVTDVQQFGGNEINSSNFRLDTGAAVYLLKRLPAKADPAALLRQLRLTAWLRETGGASLPRVLANADGGLLSEDGEARWCLFEFLSGDFFSGGVGQLEAVARAVGCLQSALRRCPAEFSPPMRWQYLTPDDAAVLEGVAVGRSGWNDLFGAAAAAHLAAHWDEVLAVRGELEAARAAVLAQPLTACHCDLHPHNLLLDGDAFAAFIDFESFMLMPEAAALGFAIYKLLRQHAVLQRLAADSARIEADAASFVRIMGEFGAGGLDGGTLRLMALAEIFRRLLVVFRLNLRDRNGAWNHVMPMHLAAFREIDVIFGRSGDAT